VSSNREDEVDRQACGGGSSDDVAIETEIRSQARERPQNWDWISGSWRIAEGKHSNGRVRGSLR